MNMGQKLRKKTCQKGDFLFQDPPVCCMAGIEITINSYKSLGTQHCRVRHTINITQNEKSILFFEYSNWYAFIFFFRSNTNTWEWYYNGLDKVLVEALSDYCISPDIFEIWKAFQGLDFPWNVFRLFWITYQYSFVTLL